MSSQKSATPLDLEPRPSRLLLWAVGLAHLGALILVTVLVELTIPGQLILVSAVLLSLWFTARQLGWLGKPAAIRRVTWQGDGTWLVEMGSGEVVEGKLLPTSYSHPWLVVLNFRIEGKRVARSVVLLRDSLDESSFRRLRVRLGVEGCVAKDRLG